MVYLPKQQEGYIPTETGLRLFYRQLGDGPETVVIPSGSWLEADFTPLSHPNRTLLFFDTRGRGASDPIVNAAQVPVDYELGDLECVRQFFRLERLALIGWSMNGTATARYAAAHPEYVTHLVMMCPAYIRSDAPYLDMEKIQHLASARMDPSGLQRLEELKQAGLDTAHPEAYCREHQQVYLVRQMGQPTALGHMKSNPCVYANEWPRNLIAFIQKQPPASAYDWRAVAASIQTPTLVLHGADDLIPLESSAEWATTIPQAALEILAGSGHYPHLEAPEAFFSTVDRFLDR